jgi:hypothetical protein
VGRFSTLQSVVALVAGLSSIVGAAYSALGTLGTLSSTPAPGEIAAVVRAAGTNRPVAGTVVEIATREDTLVTTMLPAGDGLARHVLAPGAYRVRVRHPAYADVVRDVQVVSEQTADLHFMLEPRARSDRAATAKPPTSARADSSVDAAVRAIDRGASKGRRWLIRLGL